MDGFDRKRYYRSNAYNDRDEYRNRDRYDYEHGYPNDRYLRNEFERDYRQHEGYDRNRDMDRGYRAGRDYDRNLENNPYPSYRSHDYDRSSGYGEYSRRDQDRYTGRQPRQGDLRQGYGISSFGGTSDRYNTLNSDQREGNLQEDQPYYSGGRERGSNTDYSSGMGESFPNSNRGVPNYDTGNYGQSIGTGMGSTYGGKNYGGGTGYMSGHRGGTLGRGSYGTSSGNLGGYGSMGNGTYGGRGGVQGEASHNSNRGSTELGGRNY